tara:strand:+ start:672 stop:1070 length:399 start_codon:yes stop_codon:yes gene_type:complete
MKRILFVLPTLFIITNCFSGEVNSWECNKFNGAKVVASDGTYLGEIGPSWKTDSIYNSSSTHASTWSNNSIYNEHGSFGNTYSNDSVFNESASNPPKIISIEGAEIGELSVGPSWDSSRYHPADIKYTCNWD